MLKTMQIIDSIADTAAKAPFLKGIYVDLLPKDIKFPCLLIQFVSQSETDAAAQMVLIESEYRLTVIESAERDSLTGTEVLFFLRDEVLSQFQTGFLSAGNRVLHLKAAAGGRESDSAAITLRFEYFDDRGGSPAELPLMQTINTKTQLKG